MDTQNPLLYSKCVVLNIKASNERYISADGGGGKEIHANREVPKNWETFKMYSTSGPFTHNAKVFICCEHGQYWGTEKKGELHSKEPKNTANTVFTLVNPSMSAIQIGSWVGLKNYEGRYLSIRDGSFAKANQSELGPMELFKLEILNYS